MENEASAIASVIVLIVGAVMVILFTIVITYQNLKFKMQDEIRDQTYKLLDEIWKLRK